MRIGLTGGIGSGKSAVAGVWRELGAVVIDSDVLAREVVAPGTRGFGEIALRWPSVVAADGTLDRLALARIIFGNDEERSTLNGIVHPRVRALARAREAEVPAGTLVVHVIPLLFEGEYWRTCDASVVVVAPDEARIARVIERDGIDRASVLQRMRAQIDPAEARRRATYAIDNDADLATLRTRANAVYDRLINEPPSDGPAPENPRPTKPAPENPRPTKPAPENPRPTKPAPENPWSSRAESRDRPQSS